MVSNQVSSTNTNMLTTRSSSTSSEELFNTFLGSVLRSDRDTKKFEKSQT